MKKFNETTTINYFVWEWNMDIHNFEEEEEMFSEQDGTEKGTRI